jgi:hypothetical protein
MGRAFGTRTNRRGPWASPSACTPPAINVDPIGHNPWVLCLSSRAALESAYGSDRPTLPNGTDDDSAFIAVQYHGRAGSG